MPLVIMLGGGCAGLFQEACTVQEPVCLHQSLVRLELSLTLADGGRMHRLDRVILFGQNNVKL